MKTQSLPSIMEFPLQNQKVCTQYTHHTKPLNHIGSHFWLTSFKSLFLLLTVFYFFTLVKLHTGVDEIYILALYYSCFKPIIDRLQKQKAKQNKKTHQKSRKRQDIFYFKQLPLSLSLGLLFDTKNVQVFIILMT